MSLISSKRRLVYRARLFDNDRILVGGALVVIFVRKAEETAAKFNARQTRQQRHAYGHCQRAIASSKEASSAFKAMCWYLALSAAYTSAKDVPAPHRHMRGSSPPCLSSSSCSFCVI